MVEARKAGRMIGGRKNGFPKPSAHDQDLLGARACTRCHGYIERNPVLVISTLESVVRCVNCGRLYRWRNSNFQKYPSDKREWNEMEIKNRKRKGKRNGNGNGSRK